MSSHRMAHLDDEQLLHYADGELPARKARQVRSHLEACWQCRAELEELQKTVSECARYRKAVLETCLPPPPAPWADIYRRFAEADAALERRPLFARVAEALASPLRHPGRWLPAAVALLLLWGVFHQFRHAPSVQAAQLLRKAVVAAQSRPEKPRRIQIRTSKQRVTRLIHAPEIPQAETLAPLEALFRAARYNWDDPLSAKSFQAWRDQLADKSDEVTTMGGQPSQEGSRYRIRTTTSSGELMAATLTLTAADFRPVVGMLEFRNAEWVEMTELPEDPQTAPAAAPPARPLASRREPPAPASVATAGEELQVLAALHDVGADLGDPIEVTRAGAHIRVSGVGVSPSRQQQVQDALGSMPRVVVEFAEPAAAVLRPGGQDTGNAPASPEAAGLQARVEKQAGGRAGFERLSADVLDASETMMARAYALRRLADRFPGEIEAQLGVEDQRLLARLHQEHAAALVRQESEIRRLIEPVLVALGASATGLAPAPTSAASWQPAARELFQAARRVETLLGMMLGGASAETVSEDLPAQLLSSLARLRAASESYERLTKAERRDAGR